MLTFKVCSRRLRVLKFGTAQSRPISRKRLSTKPVVCLQRHAEQHLHGQACLDRGIAVIRLSAAIAGRRGFPGHRGIEPDRQRATALERFVIGGPVPSLVGGRGRSAHAAQLPHWIYKMNPHRICATEPSVATEPWTVVLAVSFSIGFQTKGAEMNTALGSGLINYIQKMKNAAMAMADKNVRSGSAAQDDPKFKPTPGRHIPRAQKGLTETAPLSKS